MSLRGPCNSPADTFFASPEADPSTLREGEAFRFQTTVTTDSSSDAGFALKT